MSRWSARIAIAGMLAIAAAVGVSLPGPSAGGTTAEALVQAPARTYCHVGLAQFGVNRMVPFSARASDPVTLEASEARPMTRDVRDIVAFDELAWEIGSMASFRSVSDVVLKSGHLARLRWAGDPAQMTYADPLTPGYGRTLQLVASTPRTGAEDLNPSRPKDARPRVTYALESDGAIVRRVFQGFSAQRTDRLRGFSDIRAITLISRTPDYDMLLANTRRGALVTLKIPAASRFTVTRSTLRKATWARFDRLVAGPCGPRGSTVAAIDTSAKSAWLYTLSHARGLTTPIRAWGKVPGTWHGVRTAPTVTVHDPISGGERINGG